MKPNDKVICINDQNFQNPEEYTSLPKKGQLYTVREFRCNPMGRDPEGCAVMVVGIYGVTLPGGVEYAFRPSRFRLLSELKAEAAAKHKQNQTTKTK